MKIDLQDVFAFGGIGMVSAGAAWIYPPAGLIVAGAFFVWLGIAAK